MIRKSKSGYRLISKSGKTLGKHSSKASAVRQERAISISKARKSGYKIAKRRR